MITESLSKKKERSTLRSTENHSTGENHREPPTPQERTTENHSTGENHREPLHRREPQRTTPQERTTENHSDDQTCEAG
jgi:hypothetical protein